MNILRKATWRELGKQRTHFIVPHICQFMFLNNEGFEERAINDIVIDSPCQMASTLPLRTFPEAYQRPGAILPLPQLAKLALIDKRPQAKFHCMIIWKGSRAAWWIPVPHYTKLDSLGRLKFLNINSPPAQWETKAVILYIITWEYIPQK